MLTPVGLHRFFSPPLLVVLLSSFSFSLNISCELCVNLDMWERFYRARHPIYPQEGRARPSLPLDEPQGPRGGGLFLARLQIHRFAVPSYFLKLDPVSNV
jgi:hypothetical protein